ncbi:MAG: hypothetical protein JWO00_390 [Candidatus Parcubacteria bacterium]|nr:hypothetical protein [Candidatus Parcubacteria bacterium]
MSVLNSVVERSLIAKITATESSLIAKIANLNSKLAKRKDVRIKKIKDLISQAGSRENVLPIIARILGFQIKVIARVRERDDEAILLKIGDKGCAFLLSAERDWPGMYPTLTFSLYPEIEWMFGPFMVSYDWVFLHNKSQLLDICKKEKVRKVFLWARGKEFRRMKIGSVTLVDAYRHRKGNLKRCFSAKAMKHMRENPCLIDIINFDHIGLHSASQTANSFFHHHYDKVDTLWKVAS